MTTAGKKRPKNASIKTISLRISTSSSAVGVPRKIRGCFIQVVCRQISESSQPYEPKISHQPRLTSFKSGKKFKNLSKNYVCCEREMKGTRKKRSFSGGIKSELMEFNRLPWSSLHWYEYFPTGIGNLMKISWNWWDTIEAFPERSVLIPIPCLKVTVLDVGKTSTSVFTSRQPIGVAQTETRELANGERPGLKNGKINNRLLRGLWALLIIFPLPSVPFGIFFQGPSFFKPWFIISWSEKGLRVVFLASSSKMQYLPELPILTQREEVQLIDWFIHGALESSIDRSIDWLTA